MSATTLNINEKITKISCDQSTPLLWVLRDIIGLTGTKFGCGKGLCGACTVHLDGQAVRSCTLALSSVGSKKVTTIEGLAEKFPNHPLFIAWKKFDVSQCGYCQPGQIMNAAALITNQKKPDAQTVKASTQGNICRCGTYLRLQQAILEAGEAQA